MFPLLYRLLASHSSNTVVPKRRSPGSAKAVSARAVEALEARTLLSAGLLTNAFDYPLGYFNNAGLKLNGKASISNRPWSPRLGLSDGGANEASSAFATTPVGVGRFSTEFEFQATNPAAGGFTFTVQGGSPTAVGANGSGLGYAGINNSVAVAFGFDAGGSRVALGANGFIGQPTDTTASGIDFRTGHVIDVLVRYNGSKVRVTEADESTRNDPTPVRATQVFSDVNIPFGVGGPTAYAGFTGATGQQASTQEILSWRMSDVAPADADVGAPAAAGAAADRAGLGGYTVTGGGSGIGGTSDQFNFLSRTLEKDGTLVAQVNSIDQTSSSASAGLMVRDGSAANAPFAMISITAGGAATFQYRLASGAAAVQAGVLPGAAAPYFIKLVRNGPTLSGYASPDGAGNDWTLVGTVGIKMPDAVRAGLAVTSANASVVSKAAFTAVRLTQDAPLGADIGGNAGQKYLESEQMWVDVIKQATVFEKVDGSGPAAVDANGSPAEDFSTSFLLGETNNQGVYHVSMVTNQDPTISPFYGQVSNQTYDPATRTVNADIVGPPPNQVQGFSVTNTGGGATNIHVIRPGYDPANPPVFTNNYLNFLRRLGPTALRFMVFGDAIDSPVRTWAERTLPGDARQTETAPLVRYGGTPSPRGSTPKGVAWEYAIALCNALHVDLWVNIPSQADDDYVRQFANLIKNGDTVNGVTYAGLDPDLNVYVEYTNEFWIPGSEANQWGVAAATTELDTGKQPDGTPTNLDFDNLALTKNPDGSYANIQTFGDRWFARRVKRIGEIFGGVMGPGSLTTRVRPVLSNIFRLQQKDMLNYVSRVYGPPSNYFYSIAGTPT